MAVKQKTCALPGCRKAPFPSLDPCRPHLACGILHHQLLMAARFHPSLPDLPHRRIFDRNSAGICALRSCSKPRDSGSSWCSPSHKLDWIFDFISSLQSDQICQLRDCTRHVFVEEDRTRRRFCGWRHCQEHVIQSALQRHRLKLSLQEQHRSPSCFGQGKYGHEPSLESRLRSLGDYAHNGITSNDTEVDLDFFFKHPWDLCTGDDVCWLIVPHKGTRKQRGDRVTKDGFHWKQQGAPMRKGSGCTLKYFSYKRLQAKRNDGGCSYFLEEYTIANVDSFALIKLHKGKGRRKHRKANKHAVAEVVADKIDAENIPPLDSDEMSMESFYSYLLSSPTHDDLAEILGLTPNTERF